MEGENESMKLSKSALRKKGKTTSTYDGGLEGPWSHLDFWHTTWDHGLTCFSSLWLFVCVQEFVTSLGELEHEKGIKLSHDIFTYSHCIEKKGGTFVGFCVHYVPEDSSLFWMRNHAIQKLPYYSKRLQHMGTTYTSIGGFILRLCAWCGLI